MGLPPYSLPADFQSLPAATQFLVLSNQDRASYGLTQIRGLNATLNAAAAAGIAADTDPTGPTVVDGSHFMAWTANWAAGWASALYTYYEWMYDDGYGSSNIDCASQSASGCWGHRKDTLYNFGNSQVLMGAAAGTSPHYNAPAFTEVYESFPTTTAVSYLAGIEGGALQLPVGVVDAVTRVSPTQVRVRGWAFDPSNGSASLRIDVYAGSTGQSGSADLNRPDVAAAYGLASAAHGFDLTIPAAPGSSVGVYAISAVDSNQHSTLFSGVVVAPQPVGFVESVTRISASQVRINGWAFDPADNGGSSSRVDIYAGTAGVETIANIARPDVAAAYGLASAAHGFSTVISAPAGTAVAAYAISQVDGSVHTALYWGVQPVYLPVGRVDSVVRVSANQVQVNGWAFDPADGGSSAIPVDTYVGAYGVETIANIPRPDVQGAFGLPSAAHGFTVTMNLAPGAQISSYALSVVFAFQHTTLFSAGVA